MMASIDWNENQRPASEGPKFLITSGTAISAANAPHPCWYQPARVPARAGWASIQLRKDWNMVTGLSFAIPQIAPVNLFHNRRHRVAVVRGGITLQPFRTDHAYCA